LVPWGRSTLQFKITAAGTITNLTLTLILIPLYGAWGAIGATFGAESVILVLGLFVRRRFGIFWHPMLPIVAPPVLCSAAVALGIVALPSHLDRYWWAELVIGASLLAGCLCAFERRLVGRVVRGLLLRRRV